MLKKIYSSLEVGGALICVEKVRSKSSHFEDLLNQLYFDFKLQQELTEEEILSKAKSLRSSIEVVPLESLLRGKDNGDKTKAAKSF